MNDFWALHDAVMKQEIKSNQERPKRIAAESLEIVARNGALLQADATRNGKHQSMIIPRTKTKEIKISCFAGDELFAGDYIFAHNEVWLVMEAKTDENGLRTGRAWLCNFLLRFQNGNSRLIEKKIVVDDGSYSNRLNNQTPTEQGSYKLYMPLDNETEQIFIDKRLALNKTYKGVNGKPEPTLSVIRVVWIDKVSGNIGEGSRLLQMRTEKDAHILSEDNVDEMICNYIKGDEIEPPIELVEPEDPTAPTPAGRCIIAGNSSIRLGLTRPYTVSVLDENDKVIDISAEMFMWNYNAIPGIIFTPANESLNIQVLSTNPTLSGQYISLTVVGSSGNFAQGKLEIEII